MHRANQPFPVIGRIVPQLSAGEWSWTEKLAPQSWMKKYPDEEAGYSAYIGSADRAALLTMTGEESIGQIVLRCDWNSYGFAEDICVASAARRQGIDRALKNGCAQQGFAGFGWKRRITMCSPASFMPGAAFASVG